MSLNFIAISGKRIRPSRAPAREASGGPHRGRIVPSSPSIDGKRSGVDLTELRATIRTLPVDVLDELAPEFAADVLSSKRARDRQDAIARIALGRPGSRSAIAAAIHTELARYEATAWRFERDLSDSSLSRNPKAHRCLRVMRGVVPAARTLRLELAGLGRKTSEPANALADDAPENEGSPAWER